MTPLRRTRVAVLLLLATTSVCSPIVEAFLLPQQARNNNAALVFKGSAAAEGMQHQPQPRPPSSPLQSSPAEVADTFQVRPSTSSQSSKQISATKRKDTDMVQMSFLGQKAVTTSLVPLPSAASKQSLQEFFASENYRNLLFFRNDVTTQPNPTKEMMDRWSSELKLGGGKELDDDTGNNLLGPTESVIQIKTILTMPGLKILTINTIGTKLILDGGMNAAADNLPEYQFTLLESQLIPQGAAPLVWLFNKLIRYRDTTSSFTRVKAKNAGGVNCDKVVFTTEARLETRIRIPRKAMKAMPVNVERFERQGSKSIQKLLEKELEPALVEFRNAYVRWIKPS